MKKICFVTSSRADYGLLYWLMKEVELCSDFDFQLIVTGMHLSQKFGSTWKVIEKDGFPIDKKIDLGVDGKDDSSSVLSQVARGIVEIGNAYQELSPDLVVILGDRYEILAAAQSAFFLRIPIAHLHGGELTLGALDDAIRHAITKFSYFHFVSSEEYRNRVVQLGEDPDRVFNVGALGLENFNKLDLLERDEFCLKYKMKKYPKNFLITYHPVTALDESSIDDLIDSLSSFADCGQIITMPNSDPGHDEIFNKCKEYAAGKDNVLLVTSLGQVGYLSCMKFCNVVIGNSSSGVIEAPFVGTATVNIGSRQRGRMMAKTVINVADPSAMAITNAINLALTMPKEPQFDLGRGNSAELIVKTLKERCHFDKSFGMKEFYDLRMSHGK